MQVFKVNLMKKIMKIGYSMTNPLKVEEANPSTKDYALFMYRTNFQESMPHNHQK